MQGHEGTWGVMERPTVLIGVVPAQLCPRPKTQRTAGVLTTGHTACDLHLSEDG